MQYKNRTVLFLLRCDKLWVFPFIVSGHGFCTATFLSVDTPAVALPWSMEYLGFFYGYSFVIAISRSKSGLPLKEAQLYFYTSLTIWQCLITEQGTDLFENFLVVKALCSQILPLGSLELNKNYCQCEGEEENVYPEKDGTVGSYSTLFWWQTYFFKAVAKPSAVFIQIRNINNQTNVHVFCGPTKIAICFLWEIVPPKWIQSSFPLGHSHPPPRVVFHVCYSK